jgi:hypothetical protein
MMPKAAGGASGPAGDASPQPSVKFDPTGGLPYEMHRLGRQHHLLGDLKEHHFSKRINLFICCKPSHMLFGLQVLLKINVQAKFLLRYLIVF